MREDSHLTAMAKWSEEMVLKEESPGSFHCTQYNSSLPLSDGDMTYFNSCHTLPIKCLFQKLKVVGTCSKTEVKRSINITIATTVFGSLYFFRVLYFFCGAFVLRSAL